jgi:hypothetical protein
MDPVKEVYPEYTDKDWQMAKTRVLLYLRMLEIPALDSLECALEVLRRAKSEVEKDHTNPIAASIHALRRVLSDQDVMSGHSGTGAEQVVSRLLDQQGKGPGKIRSMPPMNRGHITPEKVID